ncbi:DUF4295 family protein [Blattabacterium clevelandi]|uniref:DUF4295 family protein n=1 Tax=Blattabacterium clevelandi TaxID=164516 RepID=UPI000DE58D61|nr:DUF4295 family protein [Blattabacterium clevelandi]
MSKKIVENKKKKNDKKMILAIRIIKSKKSGFYTFENKIITDNEVEKFFQYKMKN